MLPLGAKCFCSYIGSVTAKGLHKSIVSTISKENFKKGAEQHTVLLLSSQILSYRLTNGSKL